MNKKILILLIIIILILCGIGGYFYFSKKYSDEPEEITEESVTEEKPVVETASKFEVFPVRFEDFLNPPEMYGLWPYGVKGSDSASHNEGHPGWDFELKKGSKVYAVADLEIKQIHSGDHQEGDQEIMVLETNAKLNNQNIHVTYHSVVNLEPGVVEGAKIKTGEPLAEAGYPLSENSVMIHFGVFPPGDSVGSCPADFFADSLEDTINQIVASSFDMKTGKPYDSACVGKIDKELYFENYPEREKDLGGAEQFE